MGERHISPGFFSGLIPSTLHDATHPLAVDGTRLPRPRWAAPTLAGYRVAHGSDRGGPAPLGTDRSSGESPSTPRRSRRPSVRPQNGEKMGLGAATRFQLGHPGGPGRPPSVKTLIGGLTRDGRDIMEFLVKAMNDTLYPKRRLRPADRLEAAQLLSAYFWGRPMLADGEAEGPKVLIVQLKPGQDF